MARRKSIDIVPDPKGGWNVRQEGAQTPLSHHRTQRAAIDAGRPVARRNESELRIHGADGRIRDSDSHGHDPNPPRDSR